MNAGNQETPPHAPNAWSRLRDALALRAPAGLLRDPLFLLALVVALPVAWGLARYLEPPGALAGWGLLRLVGLDPLVEELLFRGLVQGALLKTSAGRAARAGFTVANAGTALLFAAAHLLYHPPLWSALVLFPALVFGFFRDRYGSVVPPVLLHVFYNACWMLA
jgi:membrane protease YdiL (CAAX protease family)